jgi:hypothetical protein
LRACRSAAAATTVVAAVLISSTAFAGARHPTAGSEQAVTSAVSSGCVVPDVRGYQTSYARALIDEARCRLGTVRGSGAANGTGIVIAERPAPGTQAPARQVVSLVLGPRPRGCRQQRFQMLDRTSKLRVWRDAVGDPAEQGGNPRPWSIALQACRPPSGPVVTLWSINYEDAVQDSSVFSDLRVLGTVVAFVETDSSQYGSAETLEVRDLARGAPGAGCPRGNQQPAARYCLLTAPVGHTGEPSGPELPVDKLAEYAIDELGDVAWVQKLGAVETLYLSTPTAHHPATIEAAGSIGGVALSAGVLSWSSGGQQHSQSVPAA